MPEAFDFETIADACGVDTGSAFDPGVTVMAGAQMHFKTAPCVIDALMRRAQCGLFGYTDSDAPAYLGAVTGWMRDVRGWPIEAKWIVPSYGTLQAICACIRMTTARGEGVIVQPPAYVLYDRVLQRTGRRRVDNPLRLTAGRYAMDFDHLETVMRDPRNKLLLLCNPHNPIMDIWDEATLRTVASLAERHGVLVVADEIFAEHALPGERVTPYASVEGAADNCVVCTSLGKAFNFTGTSHANVVIPDATLRARYIRQRDEDHYGSLSPFLYTAVTSAYTPAGKAWIDALLAHMGPRFARVEAFFRAHVPLASVCRHAAGTLLWVDFRGLGLPEDALHEALGASGVVMDRGSKYGEAGTLFSRMQVGMPDSELFPALERMREALLPLGLAQ